MSTEGENQDTAQEPAPTPTWTYPTRFCRICREDVAPTVTMYPPGVPLRFQRPLVEYKNEDEYGRLMKPCKCSGSMRYIHELCLLRSRTENRREGSLWKCHTCGYKFNFQKLAFQRFLGSRYSSATLTVLFMVLIIFFLGFVADPIINLYVDPYETLLGEQKLWDEVQVQSSSRGIFSSWIQHFTKGLISMGLAGFVKTVLLNPLNWLNLRHNLGMTSARTTQTGRDRAINVSWVAVLIGMISAFYFFYQWVQTIIQLSLRTIGNNIVDTQLPGDDDDLKPPPGWKRESDHSEPDTHFQKASAFLRKSSTDFFKAHGSADVDVDAGQTESASGRSTGSSPVLVGSWPDGAADIGRSSALDSAHEQEWSFASI